MPIREVGADEQRERPHPHGSGPELACEPIADAKAEELAELLEPRIEEAVRRCLPDALDELLDAEEDDQVKRNGSPRKTATKAKAVGNGNQPRQAPDSEPGQSHWSERPLWR